MSYIDFLNSKVVVARDTGFNCDPSLVNPALKPHQRDGVIWALQGGRRALFESFGLGKSVSQLEFCRLAAEHENGQALIVCPLGVRQEFSRDAREILHMEAPVYVRNMDEVRANKDHLILITNYERVRDGDIDPKHFACTSLDEASVLREFGSKTYQTFLPKFNGVKYKMVATATPSPNKYKELIHYAGYLEVMDTGQALTRFFQRDSSKAGNLTLYPHKEQEFWLWMSTWAFFLQTPSDLGYDDTGYALPELEVRTHIVRNTYCDAVDKDGQMKIDNDVAMSLQEAAKEKRTSVGIRIEKAKEIIDASPDDNFILWHDLEYERTELKKAIPGVVDIYGTMDLDEREKRTIDFSNGKTRLFATKKSISGSGCNFQHHCHRAIFVGIDYEFNDFIQAIHRIYRFMQTKKVVIDIIYTEAEEPIYRALMEKWENHKKLQQKMQEIILKYGLGGVPAEEAMKRSIGVDTVVQSGINWTAIHGDCVEESAKFDKNSVDMILTSIPFGAMYEFSESYNDFGHNENTDKFFEQMDYLSPSLLNLLKPGRVMAVHVKDRVLFGASTGYGMPSIEPFHAQCISHYMKHGFIYFGMITVITDVVRENNKTYRLGYSEQLKDGTKMGVGVPEYILLFRKLPTDTSTAYADEPVRKEKDEYSRAQWILDAHGFWRDSGNRLVTKEEIMKMPVDKLKKAFRKFNRDSVYDYSRHVDMCNELDENDKLPAAFMIAPPASWNDDVWDDINQMRTLNSTQSSRRKQLHVCPTNIETVTRLINRYTNPGDLVYDPFGGIGTVPLQAIKHGRRGIMTELNADYYRDAVGYLKAEEERDNGGLTLFDLIGDDI